MGAGVTGALLSGISLQGCRQASGNAAQISHSNNLRFKFAHVTDTHISTQGKNGAAMKADSIRIFEDVVGQLNKTEELDFVLFGGDNFDNSERGTADLDEFMRLTKQLNVPYYIQFGNREGASIPQNDPVSKEQFVELFRGHGFTGSSFWWSASPLKGVTVLGLDTSILGQTPGVISEEQLMWLKQELATRRDDLVLILTHHPFLPAWSHRKIPQWEKNYLIGNASAAIPILEESLNVKMILSGHHHATHVQIHKGLPYIATPATVQFPHAFRIISVDGNRAGLEFRQIHDNDIIKSGKANLIEAKSEEYGENGDTTIADYCMGSDEHRNAVLSLRSA